MDLWKRSRSRHWGPIEGEGGVGRDKLVQIPTSFLVLVPGRLLVTGDITWAASLKSLELGSPNRASGEPTSHGLLPHPRWPN